MNRVLLKQSFAESKWLLLACTAMTFGFCWLRVWFVSRLDTSRFKAILDLLPTDWRKFSPIEFDFLITYTGRVSLAYNEMIVILCMACWAIARGSDVVSGELGRGTLEMLLAQPISRLQLLGSRAFVTLFGVAAIATASWLGNYAGIATTAVNEEVRPAIKLPFPLPGLGDEIPLPFGKPTTRSVPMSEKVDPETLLPASFNLFALGVMLAGVSTGMSSWDRYRWRTIGLVVGMYVLQVAVKLAGMAVPERAWLKRLSIFSAYEPESFVKLAATTPEHVWRFVIVEANGDWQFGPWASHALLLGVGLVGYVIAAMIFSRRDLPAPL